MKTQQHSKKQRVHFSLCISDLFRQDTTGIHDLDLPIEVTDISDNGIHFFSECILPVGYYFNAKLDLYDSETPPAFSFMKIVGSEFYETSRYRYECIFTRPIGDLAEIIRQCTK